MQQVAEWAVCADEHDPQTLADSLSAHLARLLAPATVWLRMPLGVGDWHDAHAASGAGEHDDAAPALLQPLSDAATSAGAARLPDAIEVLTLRDGLRAARLRFGASAGHGGMVVVTARDDFPNAHERLVLSSACGHAACILRTRRSERRLDRQRKHLDVALDIVGDAVICADADGRIESMNRIAERLTTMDSGDAAGRRVEQVFRIVDSDGRQVDCPILRALHEGQLIASAEPVTLIDAQGRSHPIEHRASPIRDEQGRVIGAVVTFRDVADRRLADSLRARMQRESAAQTERQMQAFHLAPSFMALLRGSQHVFELANERYYELVGPRELIGKPARQALPEIERQGLLEILDEVYRSGTEFSSNGMAVMLQPDPERPPVEHILDFVFQPLRDAEGNVSGILVHGVDLTAHKRAEAALRERDARLQLFLDNASEYAEIITDRDGRVIEWLGGAEKITGWTADEMAGQLAEVIFTPEDRALGRPAMELAEAARSGRAEDRRWHMRKDGSRFYADGVMVSLREPGGELHGFGKLFRDNTAQKQAADQLAWLTAESERRRRLYEAALSNTPDLVFVLDTAHRFVYANEALLRYWQRSWSEAIGKTFEELGYPAWQAAMHHREIEQVLASGEAVRGEVPETGTHGERTFDYIIVPVLGAGSEVEAVAGTSRDVTERKRSEHRFAQVAEASQQINASLALESICQVAAEQARRIVGARRAEVSLTQDDACRHVVTACADQPDDPAADAAAVAAPRDAEIDRLIEHVCRRQRPMRLARGDTSGDAALPVRTGWLAAPMIGHGGRTLGLIQLFDRSDDGDFNDEDESVLSQLAAVAAIGLENARLYESVRQADQRKDEFLATLAHELRNPLAPMRYAIELMRDSSKREVREEAREMAGRQVDQLVRLVDDLLDVARISTGKLQLRRERIRLADVVRSAIETSRPTIVAARQVLQVELPEQPVELDADPARLAQVLLNLLTNAAKYSEPGGTIRVVAGLQDGQVELRVIDSGIGIPPPMLPQIFELFRQVDHGSKRAQGGLGIGLTLVKRLVELHGGQIEARSDGPQRGSEFIIRLPLPDAPALAPARRAGDVETIEDPRPRRVLVVDDNRDAANSLGFLLGVLGHEAQIAYDGASALDKADAFRPDVAVLDLGMPEMDGFETARRLRQLPGLSDVTLIALTGWGQEQDRRRSRDAGFDHHLVKPADLGELKKLVAGRGRNGIT